MQLHKSAHEQRLPVCFISKDVLKCFPDKVKLKGFIITKPLLYEMLKELTKKKSKL